MTGMLLGHVPLLDHVVDLDYTDVEQTVLTRLRLPRIGCGILVGAGLAVSGAGYQTLFRNPLVSPDILGVAAGAGFGGAVALLAHAPYWQVEALAFLGGLLAAAVTLAVGRVVGGDSAVLLVLAGVVVSAVFAALILLTEYLANPDDTLPAIVFWTMGQLGRQQLEDLIAPAVIIGAGLAVLAALRWPVTVLAAGDEDARTLGVASRRTWVAVVGACTLITATTVSLAGIVGWVGLLVPHMARTWVGPGFGRLLGVSAVLGAAFTIAVDDVARAGTSAEIPLGILTALIGAPFFIAVLARTRRQWT